jgi:hypothetical protein
LFKQIKQNLPLKYFLIDNENAIKIQTYCVIIVNLFVSVIKKSLKGQLLFSDLVSFYKMHFINYIQIKIFLESYENQCEIDSENSKQFG